MQKNILDVMLSLLPKTMKDNFQEGGWTWNSTKSENLEKAKALLPLSVIHRSFLTKHLNEFLELLCKRESDYLQES